MLGSVTLPPARKAPRRKAARQHSSSSSYGALLYGNTFTPREVRVITESRSFASRLPVLLDRAGGCYWA